MGGCLPVDVLTVNAGSTSLKLHLVRGEHAEPVDDFAAADAVGHRVVHGGGLTQPCVIAPEVELEIDRMTALAPLQNVRTLDGIRRAREALPRAPQVAV